MAWSKQQSENRSKRMTANKQALVAYKGGECCICGYNKCNWALHFHHVGKKNFAISAAGNIMGSGPKALERMKKEADNTILVCRNCHGEIHAGMHEEYRELSENTVRYRESGEASRHGNVRKT